MYNFKKGFMGYAPDAVDKHIRNLQEEHQNYMISARKELAIVAERVSRISTAITQMNSDLERYADAHRRSVQLFNEHINAAEDQVRNGQHELQHIMQAVLDRLQKKKEDVALFKSLVREAREELLKLQTKFSTQASAQKVR